jgi:predicted RNA polymerase sigma factor
MGPYQLQAAIAAVHDRAATLAETDWEEIVELYGALRAMSDNPVVTMNQAVALSMVKGPEAGLAALKELDEDQRVAGHYRLDAVRGHLHLMLGDKTRAAAHFRAAAEKTLSTPERDYLIMKAAKLSS